MPSLYEPGAGRGALSEINVTPMVDVMLVLLVIFMITVPVIQSGIQVQVPETRGSQTLNQNLLVVNVDRGGVVYINDQKTSFKTLAADLKRQLLNSSQRDIYVRADAHLDWGSLAKTMDEIKLAGVGNVNLVTQPYTMPAAAPGAGHP